MKKAGKYRALRNIPVGWVLQAVHATDRSERWFRVAVEMGMILLVVFGVMDRRLRIDAVFSMIVAVFVIHSICWMLTGNFWVYLLDSFLWVKNPGIESIIRFVRLTNHVFGQTDTAKAILIYGSMCRCQFHGRSDLDLRIVRESGVRKGLIALCLGYILRAYSFFLLLPVDLQVVDSMAFLERQMRQDERPIVVARKPGFDVKKAGILFREVERNPQMVFKPDNG